MVLVAIQLGLSLNLSMFCDVFRVDDHVEEVDTELRSIYRQFASGSL